MTDTRKVEKTVGVLLLVVTLFLVVRSIPLGLGEWMYHSAATLLAVNLIFGGEE